MRPGDRLQLACLAEAAEALRHVAGLTLRPDAGSRGRSSSGLCATAAAATRQRRPTPVMPLAFPSSHPPPLTSSPPSSTAPSSSSSLLLVEAAIASGSGIAGLPLGEVLGSAAPQHGQKVFPARQQPMRPTRRCKRTLACPGLVPRPSPPGCRRNAASVLCDAFPKSHLVAFCCLPPSLGAARHRGLVGAPTARHLRRPPPLRAHHAHHTRSRNGRGHVAAAAAVATDSAAATGTAAAATVVTIVVVTVVAAAAAAAAAAATGHHDISSQRPWASTR